jgi:uncharacterized protein YhbP (UPF0306 family)
MAVRVVRIRKRVSSARLARVARRLLEAAALCALATAAPDGRVHINTMYFARAEAWTIVWLSASASRHSRNLRERSAAAIAVYDSRQRWGGSDRGIQVFGRAGPLRGAPARAALAAYRRRFRGDEATLRRFAVYALRPTRVKLFDEREFGGGTFVTARVRRDGALEWERTETYED